MTPDAVAFDPQGQARLALAAVVRDRGPGVLSNPVLLSDLLKERLPGWRREASLLVTASEAGVASLLEQQVAGVGPDAAVRTIAASVAQSRGFDPRGSLWAVGEFASAMGHPLSEAVQPGTPKTAAPPPGPVPGAAAPPPSLASAIGVPFLVPVAPPPSIGAPPPPSEVGPFGAAAQMPPPPAAPGGPLQPPPPWAAPPAPPRRRGRLLALISAGAVVVIVGGYLGVAAATGLLPFKGSVTTCSGGDELQAGRCVAPAPTSTPSPPATTPTAGIASILPSFVSENLRNVCTDEPSSYYYYAGVTDQQWCALLGVTENYVLYVEFPSESLVSDYYDSLVSSNGMSQSGGDCSTLTLTATSDGSSQYCEDGYTDPTGAYLGGRDFIYVGSPSFDLGYSALVSQACTDVSSIGVLAFTDPNYMAVGVAIDCTGGAGVAQSLNTDFLAKKLNLGS
ncbi:MAG: hypothetical protein ABSA40_08615 [Candidatus Dormibacteria bacterium]|jgi:hypothetical protein